MNVVVVARVRLLLLTWLLSLAISCGTAGTNRISAPVPYVTTPPEAIDVMLKLARVTSSDTLYDLGSGDGRIPIAAASEFGARAVGVEINPDLIKESEFNAEVAGVESRVKFIQKDLFQTNISEATVVTVFLLPGINMMLAPKFLDELQPGTRIVSYLHDMGEWQPDSTARANGSPVYLWVVPANAAGNWSVDIPSIQEFSPLRLSFSQAYQKLRASATLRSKKISITDPQLNGDKLSFTVSAANGEKTVRMAFSGRLRDGRASGDVVVNGGSISETHQWTGLRQDKP